jgi:polyphenol oxidase
MSIILPEPDAHFAWVAAPYGPTPWGFVLQCRPLADVAPHFFTARELQLRGDAPLAQADWQRVATAIGVHPSRLQRMHQVHGCGTSVVSSAGTPHLPEADALVTDAPDLALVVRVADCVPLLIADRRRNVVAAVHAGWRGTAAGVALAAVRRLEREYRTDPADLVAAIGPSIGPCCYQVGPSVREAFERAGHTSASLDVWFSPDVGDRLRLDTWAANRDQLIAAGLPSHQVYVARLCTMTHRAHFYSYRAEGTSTGRLLGVIRARDGREP